MYIIQVFIGIFLRVANSKLIMYISYTLCRRFRETNLSDARAMFSQKDFHLEKHKLQVSCITPQD